MFKNILILFLLSCGANNPKNSNNQNRHSENKLEEGILAQKKYKDTELLIMDSKLTEWALENLTLFPYLRKDNYRKYLEKLKESFLSYDKEIGEIEFLKNILIEKLRDMESDIEKLKALDGEKTMDLLSIVDVYLFLKEELEKEGLEIKSSFEVLAKQYLETVKKYLDETDEKISKFVFTTFIENDKEKEEHFKKIFEITFK